MKAWVIGGGLWFKSTLSTAAALFSGTSLPVDPFFVSLNILLPPPPLAVEALKEDFAKPPAEELPKPLCLFKGTITTSFYRDSQQAGLSKEQIEQVLHLLKGEIDFRRDLRPGDRFVVLFPEKGEQCGHKPHFVRFWLQKGGRTPTLVQFKGRYFWQDGRPLRPTFISPVAHAKITSPFGARRHPIFHKTRFHSGVDFAAPAGAPVRATASGVVKFVGWQKGYGRVVIVRHDDHRTTLYAHLHRFAKGLRAGRWVRQGEVIGFVGASGRATGPHLHYEVRVDGVPRDPLKFIRFTYTPPAGFERHFSELLAQIEMAVEVASAENGSGGRE